MKFSRILIVGRGSMGQRHYNLAKTLFPRAAIAVFSPSTEKDDFPLRIRTRSELSEFKPEISVIANTADLHLEFAVFLAGLNSHLLIEKPLSINPLGIENLLEIIEQRGLHVLVGYNLPYLPSLKLLRELLVNESVGLVLDVRVQVGQDLESWRPNRDYRSSASASKIKGGGVLRELSHEISYILDLFGTPNWVFGDLKKGSDLDVDVEDIAHLILGLRHESGHEFSASIALDFVRKDKIRNCTIIGSKGTLEWNGITGTVSKSIGSEKPQVLTPTPIDSDVDTYQLEWETLLNSIDGKNRPKDGLSNAILTLQVIQACEESQSTGRKVYLGNQGGGRA